MPPALACRLANVAGFDPKEATAYAVWSQSKDPAEREELARILFPDGGAEVWPPSNGLPSPDSAAGTSAELVKLTSYTLCAVLGDALRGLRALFVGACSALPATHVRCATAAA